jgi:polysaccharide export outer membrane protein
VRYDVVDVNSSAVATLPAQPMESFRTRFGRYGKPAAPKVGIGDTLSVSIWEAAGGGLFGTSPTHHVSAGSRKATIPEQVVGRDGAISVPFAGRVQVADRTTLNTLTGPVITGYPSQERSAVAANSGV